MSALADVQRALNLIRQITSEERAAVRLEVLRLMASAIADDKRIGNSHTAVTAERGFGGHCFPKDTSATVFTADTFGVDLSLVRDAIRYNKSVRKSQK